LVSFLDSVIRTQHRATSVRLSLTDMNSGAIKSARSARELPENAVAYSWSAAALLHPLISMRNGCYVSG
jgi:hypothetical protein